MPDFSAVLLLILLSILPSPSLGISSTAPSFDLTDTPVIRNLSDTHGDSYGRPGLSHLTIAGAVHHGMKEVEFWLQTFAPGSGTPVHRHDCEEIFLIIKGKGTLCLAPASETPFPGKPDEFSIHANSSFIVPVNAVHQVWNTNEDEDLQHLVIISRPPIKVFTYGDWFTPHADAVAVFPYPWDAKGKAYGEDQCGSLSPGISVY